MGVLELVVEDTVTEDSGRYACEATNKHGTNTNHFTLLVEGEHFMLLVEGEHFTL